MSAAFTPDQLFNLWLRGESEDRDAIKVKRIYIDINDGNLVDGVLFSQIMFWHGSDKKGKPRLSISRNNHLWLAKTYGEWWEEVRIPERTAREAINRMVKRGLLEKHRWHFNGVPTVHVRVVIEKFIELLQKFDSSLIRQNPSDKQSDIVSNRQKMSNGIGRKCQMESAENVNSYNTETTTETTAKIIETSSDVSVAAGSNGNEKPLTDFQRFTGKLAELCKRDLNIKSNGKLVGFNAAELWKADYRIDALELFEKWWYASHWKGKKGQPPTLPDVKREIKIAVDAKKSADTLHSIPDFMMLGSDAA